MERGSTPDRCGGRWPVWGEVQLRRSRTCATDSSARPRTDPDLGVGESAHLASHLLARIARRIATDWWELYGHPVVLLESLVKTERFVEARTLSISRLCARVFGPEGENAHLVRGGPPPVESAGPKEAPRARTRLPFWIHRGASDPCGTHRRLARPQLSTTCRLGTKAQIQRPSAVGNRRSPHHRRAAEPTPR